jgi:hypothetical protein
MNSSERAGSSGGSRVVFRRISMFRRRMKRLDGAAGFQPLLHPVNCAYSRSADGESNDWHSFEPADRHGLAPDRHADP